MVAIVGVNDLVLEGVDLIAEGFELLFEDEDLSGVGIALRAEKLNLSAEGCGFCFYGFILGLQSGEVAVNENGGGLCKQFGGGKTDGLTKLQIVSMRGVFVLRASILVIVSGGICEYVLSDIIFVESFFVSLASMILSSHIFVVPF